MAEVQAKAEEDAAKLLIKNLKDTKLTASRS